MIPENNTIIKTTPEALIRLAETVFVNCIMNCKNLLAQSSKIGIRRYADSYCISPLKSLLAKAGIKVIETIKDSDTETDMATAISRKSCPTSSCITRIGMKTIIVVSAETNTAPQTWLAPINDASLAGMPR